MAVEDAIILEAAVRLVLEQRVAEARAELRTLSVEDPMPHPVVDAKTAAARPIARIPRPSVNRSLLATVLQRDGWTCRYCGRKLVVAGVIELIGTLCPIEFPFPPGHHMPVGRTQPAANRVYPNADHVHAGSLGGDWHDPANLVAACTPCNERKSDMLGWTAGANADGQWKGLTEYYRVLAESTGTVRSYHAAWLRTLGL